MARLDVSLGSGSINLVVPQNAGQMALHASVEHGDIVNEAGAGYRLTEKDRGAVLRSSQEGEPVLRLRTKRGTIVLRKDAGAGSVISSQGPKTPPAPPQVEQH
jgi:hypothetical protein